MEKILRTVLNLFQSILELFWRCFLTQDFLWLEKLKITRDSLEISSDKREVGWLSNLHTFLVITFPLHFYRGLGLFVKELSDHHLAFFLPGSFSAYLCILFCLLGISDSQSYLPGSLFRPVFPHFNSAFPKL